MSELTQAELRQVLRYNPRTGLFTWLVGKPGRPRTAKVGTLLPSGYLSVTIDYRRYYAHRLAYLYMHGHWPTRKVDHRNRVRHDNRWSNLREASDTLNAQNRTTPCRNAISIGVHWCQERNKYVAQLYAFGAKRLSARFDTLEEAQAAYREAKQRWHSATLPT